MLFIQALYWNFTACLFQTQFIAAIFCCTLEDLFIHLLTLMPFFSFFFKKLFSLGFLFFSFFSFFCCLQSNTFSQQFSLWLTFNHSDFYGTLKKLTVTQLSAEQYAVCTINRFVIWLWWLNLFCPAFLFLCFFFYFLFCFKLQKEILKAFS